MSAPEANTDSGLSGPSGDIDKQKGPASGSNAESPGNPLNAGAQPVKTDQSGNNAGGNAQQQGSNSGTK